MDGPLASKDKNKNNLRVETSQPQDAPNTKEAYDADNQTCR